MRIKSFFINGIILLGIVLAAGCLVPEKFTADSILNKDKSYAFTFKGTMVYVPYRMEKPKEGKEAAAAFAAQEAKMAKEIEQELLSKHGDTFKKVHYAGNGVFSIEYAAKGTLVETYFFPNRDSRVISFSPQENGTIVVSGGPKDEDWTQLEQLGVNVKGVFSLKTDAKVLEHNARKTPGFFSKSYVWDIGPGNPSPHMILKSDT